MAEPFQERRRTPRVPVATPQELRLGRRVRVRLVDISASGVLLWSDDPLPVGSEGRLNVLLGGMPFEAQAQVKRQAPAADSTGCLLGTALTTAPPQQRTLQGFLQRAGEETD